MVNACRTLIVLAVTAAIQRKFVVVDIQILHGVETSILHEAARIIPALVSIVQAMVIVVV
jgi:hypothetical protein